MPERLAANVVTGPGVVAVGHPLVGDHLVGHPLVGHPLVGHPLVGHPLVGHHLVGDQLAIGLQLGHDLSLTDRVGAVHRATTVDRTALAVDTGCDATDAPRRAQRRRRPAGSAYASMTSGSRAVRSAALRCPCPSCYPADLLICDLAALLPLTPRNGNAPASPSDVCPRGFHVLFILKTAVSRSEALKKPAVTR